MNDARDLAIVLRAGALPAPVKILEAAALGAILGGYQFAELKTKAEDLKPAIDDLSGDRFPFLPGLFVFGDDFFFFGTGRKDLILVPPFIGLLQVFLIILQQAFENI